MRRKSFAFMPGLRALGLPPSLPNPGPPKSPSRGPAAEPHPEALSKIRAFLKRNILITDLGPGSPTEIVRRRRVLILVRPPTGHGGTATRTGARGHAVTATTQHPETIRHNLETGPLLALLVLPFAGLDPAFDENQRALLQVLLGNFGLFAPDHNLVPLRALLPFTVAILIRFVGGDAEIGYGLAAGGVAGFRVAAETAKKNNFIHWQE